MCSVDSLDGEVLQKMSVSRSEGLAVWMLCVCEIMLIKVM